MSGKKDIIGIIEGDDQNIYDHSEPDNAHVTWHLVGGASTDHETLCGVDAGDQVVGTYGTVNPSRGQKVTCGQCISEFLHVKEMKITKRDLDMTAHGY